MWFIVFFDCIVVERQQTIFTAIEQCRDQSEPIVGRCSECDSCSPTATNQVVPDFTRET